MIAVVGGGFTGLSVAMELKRRGHDCRVFEGAPRVGGVIQSIEVDGRILDCGPQRIRRTMRVGRLIHDLDLEPELIQAPDGLPLLVFKDGRLQEVPQSFRAFVRSDIVGLLAKLRVLLEPLTRGPGPEELVADLFTRKVGRELYEGLLGPLYGGLYGSDPANMQVGHSLIHTLTDLGVRRSLVMGLRRVRRLTPAPAVSFRRGMETLPKAMAVTLGEDLFVGSPVRCLRADGGDWLVESGHGVSQARSVVLTAPAPAVAELLAPVAPTTARKLTALHYNPLVVVHLDAPAPLHGMGFQVAFDRTCRPLRGVTFNDCMFGRRNVFTAYLGGARYSEVEGMEDGAIAELAVEEFHRCTGYTAGVLAIHRVRIPSWDRSWAALAGIQLPKGIHLAGNWWSRPGLAGRLAEADRLAEALAGGE